MLADLPVSIGLTCDTPLLSLLQGRTSTGVRFCSQHVLLYVGRCFKASVRLIWHWMHILTVSASSEFGLPDHFRSRASRFTRLWRDYQRNHGDIRPLGNFHCGLR